MFLFSCQCYRLRLRFVGNPVRLLVDLPFQYHEIFYETGFTAAYPSVLDSDLRMRKSDDSREDEDIYGIIRTTLWNDQMPLIREDWINQSILSNCKQVSATLLNEPEALFN